MIEISKKPFGKLSDGREATLYVLKVPQGMSVVSPPSRCPTCGFRLKWHHNLPIIGYLRLRGRCAACVG